MQLRSDHNKKEREDEDSHSLTSEPTSPPQNEHISNWNTILSQNAQSSHFKRPKTFQSQATVCHQQAPADLGHISAHNPLNNLPFS